MRWPPEVGVVEVMVSLGVVRRVGDRMGNWAGWEGVGGCRVYKR